MQHLKNITAGNPKTVEQYQLTKAFDVVWFFQKMVRTGTKNKSILLMTR